MSYDLSLSAVSKEKSLTQIRLKARIEELQWTQQDLADEIGATQGAISQIAQGTSRNSRLLPKIAHALSVNYAWLAGLTDEKIDMLDADGEPITEDDLAAIMAGTSGKTLLRPPSTDNETNEGRSNYNAGGEARPFTAVRQPSPPSSVDIHELDLAFGMGGGTYLDLPVKSTTHSFSRAWLRNFTDSPFEKLLFARGMGDSMMPTILDADIVLIDTAQQSPRMNDQIWALQMHGLGMIKRLRAGPEGSMKILSDNPSVPDEVAYDGEMQVIGRVVAAVRKL